jgi:16S rRNA (guanine966-N2)-methyltransferase
MRIIAGTKKGLKLQSPPSDVSRPILDRVKESLFSVLYKYALPEGKFVADLFSGVGSLGLEALSRGATAVTFVEKDAKILSVLKKNIEKAGFAAESRIIRGDAFRLGAPLDSYGNKYDLVFIDPPYAMTRDTSVDSQLAGLFKVLQGQLAKGAIIVVRTIKQIEPADSYGEAKIIERRTWGSMNISIYGWQRDEQ